MSSSPIDSRAAARVAARLEFLEDDPLEFWDFGMVFALEVIARRLQELASIQQTVTVADMLQIIAEEREDVLSKELHVFCSMTKPLQRAPRVERAAHMAAARSNGHGARTSKKQPSRAKIVGRVASA